MNDFVIGLTSQKWADRWWRRRVSRRLESYRRRVSCCVVFWNRRVAGWPRGIGPRWWRTERGSTPCRGRRPAKSRCRTPPNPSTRHLLAEREQLISTHTKHRNTHTYILDTLEPPFLENSTSSISNHSPPHRTSPQAQNFSAASDHPPPQQTYPDYIIHQ